MSKVHEQDGRPAAALDGGGTALDGAGDDTVAGSVAVVVVEADVKRHVADVGLNYATGRQTDVVAGLEQDVAAGGVNGGAGICHQVVNGCGRTFQGGQGDVAHGLDVLGDDHRAGGADFHDAAGGRV